MNLHTYSKPNLTHAQVRSMVPNIYLLRRQNIMPRSWQVAVGVKMDKLGKHVFNTMNIFKVLAQMEGLPRADIAEGVLLILGHDATEPISVDKNIYSTLYIKVNDEAAMHAMEDGLPMAEQNIRYFHDYEDGKKDYHEDPRINRICLLAKDADGLDPVIEQIERVARGKYPRRRWLRPEVQEECAYKRANFNFEVSCQLYDAIMEYGEDAFDDAFLRLPNSIKNGTHNKHPK